MFNLETTLTLNLNLTLNRSKPASEETARQL